MERGANVLGVGDRRDRLERRVGGIIVVELRDPVVGCQRQERPSQSVVNEGKSQPDVHEQKSMLTGAVVHCELSARS